MASPFPDLPRADCDFTPTVQAFSGPMFPKPKWAGATSYDDPNFPSGGGPDDVPPAPPSMGQALPATISPPSQTSMGGGGGDDPEILTFENGDTVKVVAGDILMTYGCTGWSVTNQCIILLKNNIASNLVVFRCLSDEVNPTETGTCLCLLGRVYNFTIDEAAEVPKVNEAFGPDATGKLVAHQIGFRVVAINDLVVHFVKDIMPAQIIRATSVTGTTVIGRTLVDSTGTLGTQNITGKRTNP